MAESLTGRQIREGRALLRWSAELLAKRADLAPSTILRAERYEAEAPITMAQAKAIRSALGDRGVVFSLKEREEPAVSLEAERIVDIRKPKGTVMMGFINRRNQEVVRKTGRPGNNYRQMVYVLRCSDCGHEYGSNGSEIFRRRCPLHDGGKPGPEI